MAERRKHSYIADKHQAADEKIVQLIKKPMLAFWERTKKYWSVTTQDSVRDYGSKYGLEREPVIRFEGPRGSLENFKEDFKVPVLSIASGDAKYPSNLLSEIYRQLMLEERVSQIFKGLKQDEHDKKLFFRTLEDTVKGFADEVMAMIPIELMTPKYGGSFDDAKLYDDKWQEKARQGYSKPSFGKLNEVEERGFNLIEHLSLTMSMENYIFTYYNRKKKIKKVVSRSIGGLLKTVLGNNYGDFGFNSPEETDSWIKQNIREVITLFYTQNRVGKGKTVYNWQYAGLDELPMDFIKQMLEEHPDDAHFDFSHNRISDIKELVDYVISIKDRVGKLRIILFYNPIKEIPSNFHEVTDNSRDPKKYKQISLHAGRLSDRFMKNIQSTDISAYSRMMSDKPLLAKRELDKWVKKFMEAHPPHTEGHRMYIYEIIEHPEARYPISVRTFSPQLQSYMSNYYRDVLKLPESIYDYDEIKEISLALYREYNMIADEKQMPNEPAVIFKNEWVKIFEGQRDGSGTSSIYSWDVVANHRTGRPETFSMLIVNVTKARGEYSMFNPPENSILNGYSFLPNPQKWENLTWQSPDWEEMKETMFDEFAERFSIDINSKEEITDQTERVMESLKKVLLEGEGVSEKEKERLTKVFFDAHKDTIVYNRNSAFDLKYTGDEHQYQVVLRIDDALNNTDYLWYNGEMAISFAGPDLNITTPGAMARLTLNYIGDWFSQKRLNKVYNYEEFESIISYAANNLHKYFNNYEKKEGWVKESFRRSVEERLDEVLSESTDFQYLKYQDGGLTDKEVTIVGNHFLKRHPIGYHYPGTDFAGWYFQSTVGAFAGSNVSVRHEDPKGERAYKEDLFWQVQNYVSEKMPDTFDMNEIGQISTYIYNSYAHKIETGEYPTHDTRPANLYERVQYDMSSKPYDVNNLNRFNLNDDDLGIVNKILEKKIKPILGKPHYDSQDAYVQRRDKHVAKQYYIPLDLPGPLENEFIDMGYDTTWCYSSSYHYVNHAEASANQDMVEFIAEWVSDMTGVMSHKIVDIVYHHMNKISQQAIDSIVPFTDVE